MRLHGTQATVERGGELEESSFGFSKGDEAHIMIILRDKLYSDKISAVLREYGTNALDAHEEAGIGKTPIHVTLPTRLQPFLIIRDFGAGLDDAGIREVYTQYGRSTKRLSDSAIGQLGLGSKSAFAYSEQFSITSWCNGNRTIYNAYLDETGIGKVAKMTETDCSATHTGVEIKIPVRATDIDEFVTKARSVYYYFEPRPRINTQIPVPTYATAGGWWRIRQEYGVGPIAVMGSIGYPIRIDRLGHVSEDVKMLLQTGLEIRFKIGELAISANREDLEYTDITRQNIVRRVTGALKELQDSISAQFQKASTPWEARALKEKLSSATSSNSYGSYRQRNVVSELANKYSVWQQDGRRVALDEAYLETGGRTGWGRGRAIKLPSNFEVSPLPRGYKRPPIRRNHSPINTDQLVFVLEDVDSYKWKRFELLQDTLGNKDNYVFFKHSTDNEQGEAELTAWLKSAGLDGAPVYKLSDYDYTVTRGVSGVATTKAKEQCFKLVSSWSSSAWPKSENWTPDEIDLEDGTGVYVPLFRYEPAIEGWTMGTYQRALEQIKLLTGNSLNIDLYGVKVKSEEQMGKGWVRADRYIQALLDKALNSSTLYDEAPQWRNFTNFFGSRLYGTLNIEFFKTIEGLLPATHPLRVFWTAIKTANTLYSGLPQDQITRYNTFLSLSTAQPDLAKRCKIGYNYEEQWQTLFAKYPLVEMLGVRYMKKEQAKELAIYIQAIDERQNNEQASTN